MLKNNIQIVWFKRDLRITDHRPIFEASLNSIPTLPIYIIEIDYWKQPSSSKRHWSFIYDSLKELRKDLKTIGQTLIVRVGSVKKTFEDLSLQYNIKYIFSHEETGNKWTYDRDKTIKNWCFQHNILLTEFPSNGIVRCLKSRSEWSKIRNLRMKENLISTPTNLVPLLNIEQGKIPSKNDTIFVNNYKGSVQKGGRSEALKIIESFLGFRGKNYTFNISKPDLSEQTCTRLSPHLTFGTVSSKEIYKLIKIKKEALKESEKKIWNKNLNSVISRLSWRCHFIQKLETQPSIEFKCMHPYYEGIRENNFDTNYYNAWKKGLTGYPFIDACMRSLNHKGWITFRMRAMLVSFASYDLWLDWRKTGHHLAQTFTDYEPGIHYSQLQMQSGVTGINNLRIYNPLKQSTDHDPKGKFIKKWVPELVNVPDIWIHEPWKMDLNTQKKFNCLIGKHYPKPIIEHSDAIKQAKSKLALILNKDGYRHRSKIVLSKLGSKRVKKNQKKIDKQLKLL
ncbi:deoxyribodipyrimidine photo-lyase/cryptochrome family protein [Alphaproteobacteria bacterium]|nr:deoxyribodipyrimidine photo-lyase/cryptochrome family protein [Alphaproteobacteria bacterium]